MPAVAALNCADGNNTHVCDQFGVEGFPTLKHFPAGSVNTIFGNGTFINQGEEFDRGTSTRMKMQLIDLLEPQHPNLLSFTNHSGNGIGGLAELWSTNETDHNASRPATAIVLIFEHDASYLGRETALCLSPHEGIKVFRFSKNNQIYDTYVASDISMILSPAVLFLA